MNALFSNMNTGIKILLTGDFCPINRIEDMAQNSDYESVFNDFIDVFKGRDNGYKENTGNNQRMF